MKTSDDSDEKEQKGIEQAGNEKPEEQKRIQQPNVHGPMQQRVFEKMGITLKAPKRNPTNEVIETNDLEFKESNRFSFTIFNRYKRLIYALTIIALYPIWSYFNKGQNPIEYYTQELANKDFFTKVLSVLGEVILMIFLLPGALMIVLVPFFIFQAVQIFWNETKSLWWAKRLLYTMLSLAFILFFLFILWMGIFNTAS